VHPHGAMLDPRFLQGARGSLYALQVNPPPEVNPRGSVLHVHAFAEEHNKCRRMVASQARALAALGYTVLAPDLRGCGDSEGDF
jgi:alpha-beta hydrolase superfamily lysophospholipase